MEQPLEKTPLWLEIKTEYIDENFDKVLDYLYRGSLNENKRDSFYLTTVELLLKRVEILLDSIQSKPISGDEEQKMKKSLSFISVCWRQTSS